MSAAPRTVRRPAIILAQSESELLLHLADRFELSAPGVADLLAQEVSRARLMPDDKVPADVIGIGSTIEFIDEAHGSVRTIELVMPENADIEAGRVSIMTPIGAGLIGLRAGQSIHWPDRDGRERPLRVVSVKRAGA